MKTPIYGGEEKNLITNQLPVRGSNACNDIVINKTPQNFSAHKKTVTQDPVKTIDQTFTSCGVQFGIKYTVQRPIKRV